MQCPVCKSVNLVMADRQGIEIDYCPQCRGVWLDRGELDKIIERSASVQMPAAAASAPQYAQSVQQVPIQQAPTQPYRPDERRYPDHDYKPDHNYKPDRDHKYQDSRQHGYYDKDYRYGHKRKRESFLSDLFDFD